VAEASGAPVPIDPIEAAERVEDLVARLAQAEETIHAIHYGEVDAVVVNGPRGPQVFTLEGADHPYRVLVEQMREGTVTLDEEARILYSNCHFAAMVRTPVENVTTLRFDEFIQAPDSNHFVSMLEAARERGHASGELNLRAEDRALIPVRISMSRLNVGRIQTICLVISDLREQRRNEAIVREEQLSRSILDQAAEAIVVVDLQGVIVRCSQSAKNLARCSLLLNAFDSAFELTVAGSGLNACRILESVLNGVTMKGIETEMRHPDGETYALLLSAGPLWGETNEPLGCVITFTNITDRKRAEEALAQQAQALAKSNSDLRQFAYSASHDLREPLRHLSVFSELLQKRYRDKLDDEAQRLIQHTVDSAHQMERLLKDLLAYTQAADAPAAATGPVDANAVLRKTLVTFENQIAEAGAKVTSDGLPQLDVHEVHLLQLFQNLIGNALKYRSAAPPEIHVSAERRAPGWTISVRDNGIGIAPEYQTQIFGLFQRLHGGGKYSGSGIGLAICQKIVQRYGGKIWVESEAGRGAKFFFTLPGGAQ